MTQSFDVAVIGGGPAGLTGALYLARFRRRVLVIDDAMSRAVKIPRSHNMPGYPEGVVGAQLVAAIRDQAERHGAIFAAGRVLGLEAVAQGFRLHWGEDAGVEARLVLLATGVSDIEPAMPYCAEAVRDGLLRYCPVCDGYEVIGQAVGVLADGEHGAREALYLRDFTDRLTLFLATAGAALGTQSREALTQAGIALVETPVSGIRLWDEQVIVRHGDGETRCDSLYSALGLSVHAELLPHARHDAQGYLEVDRHQRTSVEGVYAVGDVAQGLNQISVGMGGAAVAAAAMHLALGSAWQG